MTIGKKLAASAVLAGAVVFGTVATRAAINVDENGMGFIGKGDVQLLFLWNNAQLQSCAATDSGAGCLEFGLSIETTTITEVSWICTNSNNLNTQERERTTTTESRRGGVVGTAARVKNQVTGFNLSGFSQEVGPATTTTTTEGNMLNSCPSGPWSLTTPAGDPVVVGSTGGMTLTIKDKRDGTAYAVRSTDGVTWTPVQ